MNGLRKLLYGALILQVSLAVGAPRDRRWIPGRMSDSDTGHGDNDMGYGSGSGNDKFHQMFFRAGGSKKTENTPVGMETQIRLVNEDAKNQYTQQIMQQYPGVVAPATLRVTPQGYGSYGTRPQPAPQPPPAPVVVPAKTPQLLDATHTTTVLKQLMQSRSGSSGKATSILGEIFGNHGQSADTTTTAPTTTTKVSTKAEGEPSTTIKPSSTKAPKTEGEPTTTTPHPTSPTKVPKTEAEPTTTHTTTTSGPKTKGEVTMSTTKRSSATEEETKATTIPTTTAKVPPKTEEKTTTTTHSPKTEEETKPTSTTPKTTKPKKEAESEPEPSPTSTTTKPHTKGEPHESAADIVKEMEKEDGVAGRASSGYDQDYHIANYMDSEHYSQIDTVYPQKSAPSLNTYFGFPQGQYYSSYSAPPYYPGYSSNPYGYGNPYPSGIRYSRSPVAVATAPIIVRYVPAAPTPIAPLNG